MVILNTKVPARHNMHQTTGRAEGTAQCQDWKSRYGSDIITTMLKISEKINKIVFSSSLTLKSILLAVPVQRQREYKVILTDMSLLGPVWRCPQYSLRIFALTSPALPAVGRGGREDHEGVDISLLVTHFTKDY